MNDSESSVLEKDSLSILRSALDRLDSGFRDLPALASQLQDAPAIQKVLQR